MRRSNPQVPPALSRSHSASFLTLRPPLLILPHSLSLSLAPCPLPPLFARRS